MNQEIRAYLKRTYTIIPQPYSTNLRNIAKFIETRESDAACIEVLKEYLCLCGVPVKEHL